jgi:hypothetical protein
MVQLKCADKNTETVKKNMVKIDMKTNGGEEKT